MLHKFKRSASIVSAIVAVSLATPAMANHGGWGGGWGRHRDRVDAGDILTGVLIIGGIAAIASAASSGNRNRERQREQRERDYRYEDEQQRDYRYRDQREEQPPYGADNRPEWQEGRGIDAAVNRCVGEIERGSQRVESVDSVSRDGQGWRIAGQVGGGESFACSIDGDGRIRSATIGGAAY